MRSTKIVATIGPASREPETRDFERRQTAEGREEVGAQAPCLLARRIGARTAVGAAAGLRLDGELAVALVEPLPEALAAHRGRRPYDGSTRCHDCGDYPAVHPRDKTFSRRP